MARRTDHTREELKDIIIKTAYELTERKGAEGLSARELARAIGYAPGTIYNIFKSMDDLYLAVNTIILNDLYDALSDPAYINDSKPPIENIKYMAQQYKKFAKDNHQHWRMLFTHSISEGAILPSENLEKIKRLFKPLQNLLAPYFKDKNSREHKMSARVLWASVHGLLTLEDTGKISLIDNNESLDDMINHIIETFIAGLEAS